MVFSRPAGVGCHDLSPQNSALFTPRALPAGDSGLNLTPALAQRENPYFWTDTSGFLFICLGVALNHRLYLFQDVVGIKALKAYLFYNAALAFT